MRVLSKTVTQNSRLDGLSIVGHSDSYKDIGSITKRSYDTLALDMSLDVRPPLYRSIENPLTCR